jgi:hypothetical protein
MEAAPADLAEASTNRVQEVRRFLRESDEGGPADSSTNAEQHGWSKVLTGSRRSMNRDANSKKSATGKDKKKGKQKELSVIEPGVQGRRGAL